MNASADKKQLGQYFTPAWAAEILFDAHFSHLTDADLVWEPTCGTGACLAAVPEHIPAVGTELDSELAAIASANTGRLVSVGNCLTADLPPNITAVFGNPPFTLKLFMQLMDRCAGILKTGHKAGFILPAYFLQTSGTVRDMAREWSIHQEIIPRDLFHGLSKPLIFASFIRDNYPKLIGFRLFDQVFEIRATNPKTQEELASKINGPRSVWREVIVGAITAAGGKAPLNRIYREIEGRRPTPNPFWKEQIRKVLQKDKTFFKISAHEYALNAN